MTSVAKRSVTGMQLQAGGCPWFLLARVARRFHGAAVWHKHLFALAGDSYAFMDQKHQDTAG